MAVNAGRLKLGNAQLFGTNSPSVTLASGATLDLNGQSVSNTNALTLSGTGAASAGGALINSSSTNASYAGLVTLGAATTINAQSGNISLTNAGTITGSTFGLTVDGSYDTSISSIIGTGTGTVTKNGTGTLTLSGANTNTGNMAVNAGRLKLGNAQLFGTNSPSVTVASGATLDLNGQSVSNTNALSLTGTGAASAGGVLINTSTNAASYAGLVTLAGDTTINASSGNITLSNTGTMSSGTTKVLTVDGSANTTINENTTTLRFVKNGTGTLTLNGGNTNSYSTQANVYAATINNGTVKVGHTQAFGSAGQNGFGINNSTIPGNAILVSGGTLDMNGITYNKNTFTVLSGTGYSSQGAVINSNATDASMLAMWMLNGSTSINANAGGLSITNSSSTYRTLNNRGYNLTLGGTGTSTNNTLNTALFGSGNLIKEGTGTWTLLPNAVASAYYLDTTDGLTYSLGTTGSTSAMNYLTGSISVNAGRLKLGNNGALGLSSGMTVAQGATVDLNGRTLINATNLTVTGTGAAGAGGAIVNDSATAASYIGLVTLAGDSTINATAGNITLSNIGTITGSGFGLTVDGASNTTINSIIGTDNGGITKNGTGTLILSGANTFTGNIAVNAGRLQLNNAGAIGSSSSPSVTVASGATFDLNGITASNSNNLTISGTGAAGYGAALINTGVSAAVAAAYSGNITLADNATINATGGIISLSGVISGNYNLEVAGGSATRWTRFTGASANTFSSLTLSGYDLGFTNADQLGSGTITSASANARIIYGASSAAAGTGASFSISNALNTGSSSSYILAVAPNDATNTITLNGQISGSGKLKVSAGGTLVLANTANDFTGGIEIGTGNISVASSAPLGSGNINFGTTSNSGLYITDNATIGNTFTISGSAYIANIDVASGKTAELTNVISPTTTGGKLVKTGNGILALSGVNTFGGTTTITGGTLNLKNSGSIASSGVTVGTGATLKATNNAMPSSASTGSITLNSGALVDLETGSLKANNLTVAALSGADITKISYTIGNSLALNGNLTLTGNLAVDLTSTINGAGVYDVLTWLGSRSGTGTISFIDHSNADWTMTGAETSGKYTITVASSFIDGGNYSSGSIVIPVGNGLGQVSGTSIVTAANATTITTIAGGTVTLNGSGNGIGTLSGGTLNVKAASTITTLTSGTLSVDSEVDAEVKSGTSDAKITGAGNLLKSGNGKLTLSNATSDYTGATKVAAGELEVTSVAALGSTSGVTLGTASSSTAATFNYSGSADTITSNITALSTSTSGNTVQNTGSGLLTLGGTLTKDGTVLTLAGGSNGIKVTGQIAGSSANSDLVVSSGVVTVSSSNSYNGPTFVQAGATLIADNASATGTGIVNVANGATLQVGTSTNYALTLSTGGFALTNGAIIRVYVGSVDITGLTANAGAAGFDTNYTHYDLTTSAGVTYSTLLTSGALDVTGVTAGGITIQVYSTGASTSGLEKNPFYDFKFLQAGSVTGLGTGLNIADLFTVNTTNLKYADGSGPVSAQYAGQSLSELIKVYTVTSGGNTVLMMSIPEPSTYGLGLGALALAAVAIRRRKQKKVTA
jgi:autotransporter-associated beta strand protein